MRSKKIKVLIFVALIVCINSVPVISYAKDKDTGIEITEESKIQIEENWLTREVATQLNKKVRNLTETDFLNIKKIDLKYEKIDNSIPEEIGLLKNLEYLDLNYTRIDGEVPESLGDLPKLTHLDLGDNRISSLPENLEEKIVKGTYSYCDVEGSNIRLNEGWHYLKGKWCYINRWGDRLKGTQSIDGKEYEFTDEGNVRVGWETNDGKSYYYDFTDGLVKDKWKNISGKWYYFNEEGIMQKGLQTIKGVKFYLNDDNGEMITGWKQIDNKKYYFTSTGGMKYGWLTEGNNIYYLDENTGEMVAGEEKIINDKKYRFYGEGILMKNVWIDNYTYAQPNGEIVNTYYNYSHSDNNYNLFKYMTNTNNQVSVNNAAVILHNGDESNNCVYFLSESLRRVGFSIPNSMCNTYQFENELKRQGFVYSYDLSQLKPGDIVFTNNYSHVYTFMCWDKDGYGYIVDNQGNLFGNQILHRRNVLADTYSTDRATHFYYYPY